MLPRISRTVKIVGYTKLTVMKRSQLGLAAAALPLDYLMVVLAGVGAYFLRFETFVTDIRPIRFELPLAEFLPTLLVAGAVWVGLFALVGLYAMQSQLKLSAEIARVFVGCTSGLAIIIVLFFFNPNLFGSRFIVLAGWVGAFFLVSLGRLALRLLRSYLHKRGYAVSQALLIGAGETTNQLERLFSAHQALGVRVVQRSHAGDLSLLSGALSGLDEIIIGDPTISRQFAYSALEYCQTHHLGFRYAADLFDANVRNVSIQTLAGVPLIEIKRTPLDGWGRIVKRLFDIAAGGFLLAGLSPLMAVVGLVSLARQGRPVFVGLERVGEEGRVFKLYKFRSMVVNAHELKRELMPFNERADGPLFKMKADPRITRWGRFLRRTSIDELPQLWNVVRGNMSLVGPRPHEPGEVEQYSLVHHKLLNLKPGMTGLAQVSGRSDLPFEDEAKLDTFYVENWSLGQDLVIMLKTVVVVFQRGVAV